MKYLFFIIILVIFMFSCLFIIYRSQQKNIENFDSRDIYYKTMPYQCGIKQEIDLSKNTPFAPI
jgi:hypothetical protein